MALPSRTGRNRWPLRADHSVSNLQRPRADVPASHSLRWQVATMAQASGAVVDCMDETTCCGADALDDWNPVLLGQVTTLHRASMAVSSLRTAIFLWAAGVPPGCGLAEAWRPRARRRCAMFDVALRLLSVVTAEPRAWQHAELNRRLSKLPWVRLRHAFFVPLRPGDRAQCLRNKHCSRQKTLDWHLLISSPPTGCSNNQKDELVSDAR